jgi:hypothetical protein
MTEYEVRMKIESGLTSDAVKSMLQDQYPDASGLTVRSADRDERPVSTQYGLGEEDWWKNVFVDGNLIVTVNNRDSTGPEVLIFDPDDSTDTFAHYAFEQ